MKDAADGRSLRGKGCAGSALVAGAIHGGDDVGVAHSLLQAPVERMRFGGRGHAVFLHGCGGGCG